MKTRNLLLCLRISAVLGLICSTNVIAVPPPGARTVDGQTITREMFATQALSTNAEIADASAAGVDASGITLLSHVPVADFGGGSTSANDCWGYVSPSGREYALIACGVGALVFGLLPLLLHLIGTGWKPGVRPSLSYTSRASLLSPESLPQMGRPAVGLNRQ